MYRSHKSWSGWNSATWPCPTALPYIASLLFRVSSPSSQTHLLAASFCCSIARCSGVCLDNLVERSEWRFVYLSISSVRKMISLVFRWVYIKNGLASESYDISFLSSMSRFCSERARWSSSDSCCYSFTWLSAAVSISRFSLSSEAIRSHISLRSIFIIYLSDVCEANKCDPDSICI